MLLFDSIEKFMEMRLFINYFNHKLFVLYYVSGLCRQNIQISNDNGDNSIWFKEEWRPGEVIDNEDDKGIYVFLQTKKKIKSESCSIFSGETKKLQLFFLSH